jgi:IS30 family transposase
MAAKKKGVHLSRENRDRILEGIINGETKVEIAKAIHCDPTTIAKEMDKHSAIIPTTLNLPMQCSLYKTCKNRKSCSRSCKSYVPFTCKRRDRSPGACNGCSKRSHCRFEKRDYNPVYAQKEYETTLRESREGVDLTSGEAKWIGDLVKQLLDQGQSPAEIIRNNPDLGICEKTLYNYIESGVLRISGVTPMDLRRQVGMRERKQSKDKKNEFKKRKDHSFLNGRKTEDLEAFMAEKEKAGEHVSVVEMDTMYNDISNGPFIQTFKIIDAQIALAIYHDVKTADEMNKGIDIIEDMLGKDLFEELFTVIKTDRGSEFERPEGIEVRQDGSYRTHVFYCDAQASWQKAHVENKHIEYRFILPNETDFRKLGLTGQASLNLVLSHLNSRTLDSSIGTGKQSPFQFARFFYPELVDKMNAFGIEEIDPNYVILEPYLLNEKKRNAAFQKIKTLLNRPALSRKKK